MHGHRDSHPEARVNRRRDPRPHQARTLRLLRPLEAQDGPQQVQPSSLQARPVHSFRIRSRVGRGGQSRREERVQFEAREVRRGGKDQNHKRGENFHRFGVEGGQGIGRESPWGVEERSHQRRGLTKGLPVAGFVFVFLGL
ncbi:hypothetical protein SO802_015910 [Lithocarpus litseifolius]|uniref:Uncharacterized protein n=1 Tax=Lithocarpus litseifolius TaxID=425828 RepID=A0AAW2CVN0_9ROSI